MAAAVGGGPDVDVRLDEPESGRGHGDDAEDAEDDDPEDDPDPGFHFAGHVCPWQGSGPATESSSPRPRRSGRCSAADRDGFGGLALRPSRPVPLSRGQPRHLEVRPPLDPPGGLRRQRRPEIRERRLVRGPAGPVRRHAYSARGRLRRESWPGSSRASIASPSVRSASASAGRLPRVAVAPASSSTSRFRG